MEIEQDSILNRTNQAWKVRIANLIALLGTALFVSHFIYNRDTWQYMDLKTAGGLILLSTLYCIFSYSIKCPKCRLSWWWHAIKSSLGSGEFKKLFTQKECPNCGFSIDTAT
jgi:hypothetical protein